jgi:hypothetical protein
MQFDFVRTLVKVNRKTVNYYYNGLREKILKEPLKENCGMTANLNLTSRISARSGFRESAGGERREGFRKKR